jgi:hypothetical protein
MAALLDAARRVHVGNVQQLLHRERTHNKNEFTHWGSKLSFAA